jgi:hypothetical protein
VVQAQLEAKPPLSLAFAIPDHPWVDAADGAAVRIAMTVGAAGEGEGCLLSVRDECETDGDERNVTLVESRGSLHADLRIGANLSASVPMLANSRKRKASSSAAPSGLPMMSAAVWVAALGGKHETAEDHKISGSGLCGK